MSNQNADERGAVDTVDAVEQVQTPVERPTIAQLMEGQIVKQRNGLALWPASGWLEILHGGLVDVLFGTHKHLSFEPLYRTSMYLFVEGYTEFLHAYVLGWLKFAAFNIPSTAEYGNAVRRCCDILSFGQDRFVALSFRQHRVLDPLKPVQSKLKYVQEIGKLMRFVVLLERLTTTLKMEALRRPFLHWFFRVAPLAMRPGGKARKRDLDRFNSFDREF